MATDEEVYSEAAVAEINTPISAVLETKDGGCGSSEKATEKKESTNSDTSAEGDATDCVRESDMNSNRESKSERKMKDFVDFLKKMKLNPLAKEFIPSYYCYGPIGSSYYFVLAGEKLGNDASPSDLKKRYNNNASRKRTSRRASKAQTADRIKRTVYVSDIDHNITEERLADLFSKCGQIIDCRVCGDPRSRLRFGFVEFADEFSAKASISLNGMNLESSSIKVLPSKTAILPVNPTFLPRSEDEREMCARTVYCTNIDRKASEDDVKNFFETKCGEVSQLRLLVDHLLSTKIAFVEFAEAESATSALDCSGEMLGSRRIRISPSKTPVRPLSSSGSNT